MSIRYVLLALALALGYSPFVNAQPLRTYGSCWIESTDKERSGYNYRLQVAQKNGQTTLTIYRPWGDPRFNPHYIIRYNEQGKGTWQESTLPPRAAVIALLQNPRRWQVVFDSTACVVYAKKGSKR